MTAGTPQAPDARRFLLVRLGVLAAALGVGLVLHMALRAHLAAIQALAETDVLAAREQLAGLLRVGAAGLFSLTGAVGVSIAISSRRAIAERRWPPSGIWGWGAVRTVTGVPARRMAIVGIVLGVLLVLCSATAGALTWHIAATLLACRAIGTA